MLCVLFVFFAWFRLSRLNVFAFFVESLILAQDERWRRA